MAVLRNISNVQHGDVGEHYNTSVPFKELVSDEMRLIFQWIFYSIVAEFIAVFGAVANIINIVCFVKQGFQDAVNISLLSLSVSDLGSLLTLIWTNICFSPGFSDLDLPFEPMEIQYLSGSGPHVIFTRVTGCITAFITLERCLCITMPLKVKTMITPKRVKTILIIFFLCAIGNGIPVYYVSRCEEKYFPAKNKTKIGLIFTQERDIVEAVVFASSSCFVQLSSFIIVLVCTITLVVKLRNITKWREMSTAQCHNEKTVNRDQKVTKMVVTISTLFIACFIPVCVIMVAMVLKPELSIEGKQRNLFISVFSMCFVLESINSSVNIFIYYQMSSRYKATIRRMFCLQC